MPLREGPSSVRAPVRPRRVLIPGILPNPVVLDVALKFAFDVFEVIGELSESQLRLAPLRRPNFHPGLANLMTPEMKLLFKEQWDIGENLKVIYLFMNIPHTSNHEGFVNLLKGVLKSYKKKEFSRKLFVEFLFCLAFWTLVLRQRKEWIGATDYAVELITIFTRHVLDKGGFDGCREWPKKVKTQAVDFEIPSDDEN